MADGSGTPTNISGSIATGGTAQSLLAYEQRRQGFSVLNNSSGNLYINDVGGTAVTTPAASITIAPGALYESPHNQRPIYAVSIIGATTSQAFTAREW